MLYQLFTYIVFMCCLPGVCFSNSCEGTVESPCIVIDNHSDNEPLRAYRTGLRLKEMTDIQPLRISGSAPPTQTGWQELITKIRSQPIPIRQIWVLDLRQESHLYVNGQNVTHAIKYNWINSGLSLKQIIQKENEWMNTLNQFSTIENALDIQQFKEEQFDKGIDIPIEVITLEKNIIENLSINYLRMPIQDHSRPDNDVVDAIIEFFDKLHPDDWVHAHCRGGKGRTTTIMAMYDMLLNAKQLSFDDIIARQKSIPPHYDLELIDKGIPDLTPYYQERLSFLRQFYNYALAHQSGFHGNWSDWLKTQGKMDSNRRYI